MSPNDPEAPVEPSPAEPSAPGAEPRPSRWARWRRRLLVVAGGGLVFLLGFGAYLTTCFAEPPALDGRPAILDAVARVGSDGRTHLGRSWFEERLGGSRLYVEGDPFTLGYANATLTAKFLEVQERSLFETVEGFFPNPLARWGVATLVLLNNKSLPDHVPLEYRREIHGLSAAGIGRDPYPQYGSRYHRILNYHAAHDISHWVWDKPVVGCTSFAAVGSATRDGGLVVARAFDFEAGRHFDTNKIVGLYRPTRGHAFLSVTWPGMAGAVTGLNERRLFCAINGAHSEDKGRIGTPVSLVVRQVLQYAGTIEEAVAIVRDAQVFVSDSYLVADGKTGQAVVIEKTPTTCAVRALEDGLLLQANHFETPELAPDPGNQAYLAEGTSLSRHGRLSELLAQARGRIDAAAAVAILRDRRGPEARDLPLGHRGAIDALISTHAVVADVTRGVLWVSRGPHQLGAFEPHTIEGFGAEDPALPVFPPDPLLASGAYARVVEARALIAAAEEDPAAHVDGLGRALELNPRDSRALELLGQAVEAQGDPAGARARYREALAVPPPFGARRDALEAALERLGSE